MLSFFLLYWMNILFVRSMEINAGALFGLEIHFHIF